MSDPVIDLLEDVWVSIIELGEHLTEADWKLPTDLPGWTVQDNLSHIVGTELMMRGEPGPDVPLSRTDHLRNPIGELNELWVESRRSRPGSEVLAEFEALAASRLAEYRAITPAQLDEIGPTPLGDAPFRDFIAVRVMDSWAHEQDMRRAVGRPGHLTGPAVEHSIGRVTRAMPMVVGKRAGAPDGASVVFVIEGEAGGIVPVVITGRAAIADVAPDQPTVTLTMDVETYAAVGFGRWSPDDALADGRITIEGDDALGRAVVHAMNFMI
jgi:uncharacterized protein (TIGR03083 family)